MYTGIAATAGACSVLFYICHHKNDATDVEEDAIGRNSEEMKNYRQVEEDKIINEYQAEKGPI